MGLKCQDLNTGMGMGMDMGMDMVTDMDIMKMKLKCNYPVGKK